MSSNAQTQSKIFSKTKQNVIVVDNGIIGQDFVEALAQDENFHITVLSAESRLAYDCVHLTEYFSGKAADDLALSPL